MAKKEGITLRRSYARTTKRIPTMVRILKEGKKPVQPNDSSSRLVRELERKLTHDQNAHILSIFKTVLKQAQHSKDKIYSLPEPHVYCIAKGKAHKKYEYGNKVSVVLTQNTGLIVGAMGFETNR